MPTTGLIRISSTSSARGSHFIVGFNIELDLLAGECADSVEQTIVSAVLSRCSCLLVDDAIGDGCKGGACTHLINILAAP